nr:retrotransposon protein, putative, Ty1-copia subclass [Tanacetum cinerariifolium]
MLAELKEMFKKSQAAPGKSVSARVLEMKGYMDQLYAIGKSYDNDRAINLINLAELHALLIDYKKGLKDKSPTPQVFTIQKGKENKPKPQANKKDKSKGKTDKNKKVVPYQPKPKHNPLKRKEKPNKDQTCHHCHVAGHWKSNCPLYLEELRKNKDKAKHGAAASSNLFMIALFNLTYKLNSWVYDTECGIHVCNTLQGFKEEMKLSYGEQYPQVGNEAQAAIEAIGQLTSPYTPQQNGVYERRNRTLLDMVRSMFNLTKLPLSFWDYALESLESVVRILNMVPTKNVDKTPYEIWHGKAPNLSYLKVWGCEAYVKRDSADKLHQRSIKCIFVGYPKKTMGYYFYFPPENKVIVASEIPVESKSLGSPPELIPVRRSERTTCAPNRLCLNIEVEDDEVGDLGEPTNYKAAMLDPDKMHKARCGVGQNLVSRYQQNPGKLYWVAVEHILKYLRNIRDMFLVYGEKPDTKLDVTGLCDASWQCDKDDDTKSQTGYVFVVNGGAVDWKSKKQTTIAMHLAQAEYIADSETAMEAVWIRKFVGDLGTFSTEISLRREQVETGEIKLIKVHTDDNLADPFTKALPRGMVIDHAKGIGFQLARYPKETMGYYFYFPPENKVIVAGYENFLERDLISQKFSGRDNDLEDDHMDTLPSENASKIPVESESLGSPSKLIPVR